MGHNAIPPKPEPVIDILRSGEINPSSFSWQALVADYGDVDGEAHACRHACALFDFSFLSIAELHGPRAINAVAAIIGHDLDAPPPGRIRYALRSDDDGRLLSDLTIWNLGNERYRVMSGAWRDVADLLACAGPGVECRDLSKATAVLALQGPAALNSLNGIADIESLRQIPYFGHACIEVAGVRCLVGRLGYTGERGFELLSPENRFTRLWEVLAGRARPAGFAAADRLRIEAGLLLFANEFRLPVTAVEVGLQRFAAPRVARPRARLVCFRADCDETPLLWQPRDSLALPNAPGTITVTSAAHSALAGATLGLGYVLPGDARQDTRLEDPWGVFRNLRIATLPYYDHDKKQPRQPWD